MSGGVSEGSGNNAYSSSNSSLGSSMSQSAPQLTAQQLLNLYSTAIPQINNTATATANANNPALTAANKGATSAINAINLNGLSPGEYNATERAINQGNTATGNLGVNNGTNTISNAMNFGGAFNNKLGVLNNTVGAATGASNATTTATGGAVSNVSPLASNASGQVSTSNSLMSSLGSSSGIGSNQNSSSQYGLCCFIFLEAYYGKLPWYVRKCRDKYYRMYPNIAEGYKLTANLLVPLMKEYQWARRLVWLTMIKPLTYHGASIVCNKGKWKHRLTRKFWFSVWNLIGKVKAYAI